jgi:hypothetical protein
MAMNCPRLARSPFFWNRVLPGGVASNCDERAPQDVDMQGEKRDRTSVYYIMHRYVRRNIPVGSGCHLQLIF